MNLKTFQQIQFGTKVQTKYLCLTVEADRLRGQSLEVVGKNSSEVPPQLQVRDDKGISHWIPITDIKQQ